MKSLSFHPALQADLCAPLSLDFKQPFAAQVENHLRNLGDFRGYREVALGGQAVGAILTLATLEMVVGLPEIVLYGFGQTVEKLGTLNLADWRHNVVRRMRDNLTPGDATEGYTILDGAGRGLTQNQAIQLSQMLGCDIADLRVINVNMGQIDFGNPTLGMAEKIIASGVTFKTLTSGRVLYLPPGAGLLAAVQATAIYGLSEVWSRVVRLSKVDEEFFVAEICDAQAMRQVGSSITGTLLKGEAPIAVSQEMLMKIWTAKNLGDVQALVNSIFPGGQAALMTKYNLK